MKKIIAMLAAVVLMTGLVATGEVQAADEWIEVDDMYFLTDAKASTGSTDASVQGYYLSIGSSSIVEHGKGKIGAGGDTSARRIVDEISVTVVVQRQVNGAWQNYLTWSAKDTNSAYVSTSKMLYVPTGYYYSVCCSHYAATDTGYSNTNALYI